MRYLLLCVSTLVGVLLGEVLARTTLTASDYLSVEMVQDEVLGAVPSTRTRIGGFDAWGFRNRLVPKSADIVAIGDSHTYGNTATMADSWPLALARLSKQHVYNMALGGYGPNQYFHLLTTRAITLNPRTIIVGLYMGDDFENAFLITYGLQHWAYLRKTHTDAVNFSIWVNPPTPTWHKRLRVWLSRHSLLYQLIFHSPAMERFQGAIKIKTAAQVYSSTTTLSVPEKNILEAFSPQAILQRLDQRDDNVREGMRITFKLLSEMSALCKTKDIQFLIAVIPTKEMVFAEYLEHNSSMPFSDVIDELLTNERLAREKTFEFLTTSGISYVDTLPSLQRALSLQLYARTATDMHPNRNGYRVIAESIWNALQQHRTESQADQTHHAGIQDRSDGTLGHPAYFAPQ